MVKTVAACGAKRFAIYYMSGEQVPTGRLSTRIDDNTTVGWLLQIVAGLVQWPASHVQLIIGGETFSHVQFLKGRSPKLLSDFEADGDVVHITVTRLSPPCCLCDFAGCCVVGVLGRCDHTGSGWCFHCGNNGTCRSGSCGHKCCELAFAEGRRAKWTSGANETILRHPGLLTDIGDSDGEESVGSYAEFDRGMV
jgi:hypothetical protein